MHAQCSVAGKKISGWERGVNDALAACWGGVTLLHADTLILPWQFKLDGYHKAILTIIRGTTHNTSSIFNISPTPT